MQCHEKSLFTHGEVVAKLMNHALSVWGRNLSGLRIVTRKYRRRFMRKRIAIPSVTVTMNIPMLEKVPVMSLTFITAPAIMKQTPIGVRLKRIGITATWVS